MFFQETKLPLYRYVSVIGFDEIFVFFFLQIFTKSLMLRSKAKSLEKAVSRGAFSL